ncbi:MAG: hypothetical protein HYX90_08720 [Chloroflexi bacterium]|nr:hypothetical protein [Chloroflexota bacterium]
MVQEPAQKPKKMVPLAGGSFTIPKSPSETAQLIGTECPKCGALFFPKKLVCLSCGSRELVERLLSPRGKIHSYTVSWRGQDYSFVKPPYGLVLAWLPEGLAVEGVVTEGLESLAIGKEVRLVIEKVSEDEDGNDVMGHKFRLV